MVNLGYVEVGQAVLDGIMKNPYIYYMQDESGLTAR